MYIQKCYLHLAFHCAKVAVPVIEPDPYLRAQLTSVNGNFHEEIDLTLHLRKKEIC